MSRIGKLAIKLDPKVKASVASGAVAFEGPKGKMKVSLPPRITADVKDGQIHVQRPDDTREARSLHQRKAWRSARDRHTVGLAHLGGRQQLRKGQGIEHRRKVV